MWISVEFSSKSMNNSKYSWSNFLLLIKKKYDGISCCVGQDIKCIAMSFEE
jgi:hypothetical protein